MTVDCTLEHVAGKDNHIADTLSAMHKHPEVSTFANNLVTQSIDSAIFRPYQEIRSKHINLSYHFTTSSSTSNWLYYSMPFCGGINLTYVLCDYNKWTGIAETIAHYHSCPYLEEEDIQLTSEDDYKVIETEKQQVFLNTAQLSLILEQLFEKYKASSANVNMTDGCTTLSVVSSQAQFTFCYTTSSPIVMRNEWWDSFIRLLKWTHKRILTWNSHKLLSNGELVAIVRNANKNIYTKLHNVHTNFQ